MGSQAFELVGIAELTGFLKIQCIEENMAYSTRSEDCWRKLALDFAELLEKAVGSLAAKLVPIRA